MKNIFTYIKLAITHKAYAVKYRTHGKKTHTDCIFVKRFDSNSVGELFFNTERVIANAKGLKPSQLNIDSIARVNIWHAVCEMHKCAKKKGECVCGRCCRK